MSDESKLLITPQTKVGELLEAYPELEAVLIDIAPPFKKLRNPVLRRTVARVTSLAQAARVGNVSVEAMVRRLRQAVGQPEFSDVAATTSQGPSATEPPSWVDTDDIVARLDARAMIERGEQPIGVVLDGLKNLAAGAIFELVTPFEPAPLIDKATDQGHEVWVAQAGPGEFHTYFRGK